jgi:GNAT superfamily N-acetyltransferase
MIEIQEESDPEKLETLKSAYLANTTAPLDGMWLCGFLPLARHFGFYRQSGLIGYCCINADDYLLQFHMHDTETAAGSSLLARMLTGDFGPFPGIKGAFVSTAEPDFLSLCFDNFSSFKVNALMYQLDQNASPELDQGSDGSAGLTLEPIESNQLPDTIEFGLRNLGAPEEWLTGYWSNLVERRELFGCWLNDELMGTGENRKFEQVQPGYTDLGVMVDQDQRGKGLATWILRQLVHQAEERGLKPMCSTERDNIGAQKAISRAGFVSRNRIIQFSPVED